MGALNFLILFFFFSVCLGRVGVMALHCLQDHKYIGDVEAAPLRHRPLCSEHKLGPSKNQNLLAIKTPGFLCLLSPLPSPKPQLLTKGNRD